MSNLAALSRQVDRMLATVQKQNAPRVIDCTGARDALIAKLQMYQQNGDEEAQVEAEPLTQEKLQAFKAMLAQMVQEHEKHGVKLVSREDSI